MSGTNWVENRYQLVVNPEQRVFDEILEQVVLTEGWSFQKNDYQIWNQYEGHWFLAIVDGEKCAACVSLCKSRLLNGEPLFTVALFYCRPEYRGMGFGHVLFNSIKSIYGNANVSLFGVMGMVEWYEKRHGFERMLPYTHSVGVVRTENIEVIRSCSNDSVESRRKMMKAWLTAPGTFCKLARCQTTGRVLGFGALREALHEKLIISPLYAESYEAAVSIIVALLLMVPRIHTYKTISAVYPTGNRAMDRILSTISNGKFEKIEYARNQFTNRIVASDTRKVFAIRHCAHGYV
ncbi:unnamed protein product [Caenorhabditis bovis]|uniref:N-acetyltransferase domain-containing protein n=1 Tax=Caenorhabditis bovis TaxID=2654633 RepID=A0A8S1FC16_9PELO|nr:unnamed protein product [Caenorhabditis bovis]